MTNRDELLQKRLAELADGVPLEQLLDGLTDEEVESLNLAAALKSVHFAQDETVVAGQRAKVVEEARRQFAPAGSPSSRLLSWLGQFRSRPRTAFGLATLLLVAVALSLWLGQMGQPGGSQPTVTTVSDAGMLETAQETSEEMVGLDEGSPGDGLSGTVDEAMIEQAVDDQAQVVTDLTSSHQVFVPVVGHDLVEKADKAILSQTRGLVEVATADSEWTTVAGAASLGAGHFLRTGHFSSATLTFYDGSEAEIGPDSQLVIERLNALRPEDGFRTVVLLQQQGETTHAVRFRNDAGSLYQVKTPTGSGIARGTRFQVKVDEDAQASYVVTEGKVDVSNASRTVSVLAGQQTSFAPQEAPQSPQLWVSGAGFVTQTGDVWIIAGSPFSTTVNTVFEGNPEIDDFVYIEGHLEGDIQVADLIQQLWTPLDNRFSLTGEVNSVGEPGETWLVAGQTISVTAETEVDPLIEENSLVRVSGTILQPEGELIALSIELLNPIDMMPFEFVGVTQSISETWTVSGIELHLADDVEIDQDIEVGDKVKVEGFILEDGTWQADEIRLLEKQEAYFEFTGTVSSIITPTWTVAGISFEVDLFTLIEDGISTGDVVRVFGVIRSDGTWLASSIEKLDSSLLELVFVGVVDDLTQEPWIINGLPIFTDGADIDPDIAERSLVRVTAVIQADETWLATRIELLSSELPDSCVTITAVITGINETTVFLSNGQSVLLNGIIVEGELSVNSVVAIVACFDGNNIEIVSITIIYDPIELPPPPQPPPGDDGSQESRGVVCHKPDTPAEKTMSLPLPAIPSHLGHGDTEGPCDN